MFGCLSLCRELSGDIPGSHSYFCAVPLIHADPGSTEHRRGSLSKWMHEGVNSSSSVVGSYL